MGRLSPSIPYPGHARHGIVQHGLMSYNTLHAGLPTQVSSVDLLERLEQLGVVVVVVAAATPP